MLTLPFEEAKPMEMFLRAPPKPPMAWPEVGEDEEGVVVVEVGAEDVGFEVEAGVDGDAEFGGFVHDVAGGDGFEAVVGDGLPVVGGVLALAAVGGAAFDDGAVEVGDEGLDKLGVQEVVAARLTGGDFDADAAFQVAAEGGVDFLEVRGGDFADEINF